LGASRDKSKPGQQVKSSRPARPCQRYSLAFSSMPTRSICFCFPVTLATAGPAASVRRRSQLRSNTRGFWSTQLVCPLLSTMALAVTHPGEARTFSERPCSFCCQIGPANGIAECRMQVGRTLVSTAAKAFTNGRSLGAGCARDAGSTQHDQARCRPVNRNHKFLFSVHTCDDADSPRKPAFARFRMALSRGLASPCRVYWVLLTLGETVHIVWDQQFYARPLSPPRDDLVLFEYYSC
jgi:hypothetical protein